MLCLYDSLEWGILRLICVWRRDRDVTGEGHGWRNGHGWGWREFFNIIMLEMPIPLYAPSRKCHEGKISLHLSRGHGKSHPPIRRSVDCHICLTARDTPGSMPLNVWGTIRSAQVEKDSLTGHTIRAMMQNHDAVTTHCRLNNYQGSLWMKMCENEL